MAETVGSSAPCGLSRARSRAWATVLTTADSDEDEVPPQALHLAALITAGLADDKAARPGPGFSSKKVAKGRSGSMAVIAAGTTMIGENNTQLRTSEGQTQLERNGSRIEEGYLMLDTERNQIRLQGGRALDICTFVFPLGLFHCRLRLPPFLTLCPDRPSTSSSRRLSDRGG